MIDKRVLSNLELFGAWCGLFYVIGILVSWGLIAGFLPPMSPSTTAEEVATIFREDTTRIRIGMIGLMFAAVFLVPFSAAVSRLMAKIEDGPGVLSYSVLLGGAGTMILTFYPAIWWLWGLFRPERAPELLYLINDLAWLQLIGGVSMFYGAPMAIAIAAFFDRSEHPVFPRWSGFYNIWVMVLILPDQLLFFFHRGPFSWNGFFGLWLPLVAFGSWFLVTAWHVRKAILCNRTAAA